MSELSIAYNKVIPTKKRPFDIDSITETLISEPINLDLNIIAHTPVAVIVNLPREEYTKKRIGTTITRSYDAYTICKDSMLVIKSTRDLI